MKHIAPLLLSITAISACQPQSGSNSATTASAAEAFASTYVPKPDPDILLRNATLIDGVSDEFRKGDLLVSNGKIAFVGSGEIPDGVTELDLDGRFLTPGIIDIHSHLGNYPSPGVHAHGDGNEVTSPITSEVYAEHGIWPQDPGFDEALQGGVTTLHVLPGSANLFGGRGVTLRNVPSRGSRMGNVAGYRTNWIRAEGYKKKRDNGGDFERDLQLETLADVLDGKILVQMHCYRADEMVQILDIAKEFNYKVGTFHHAVEAYKIGDYLKDSDTCAAMWADWGAFKMESFDYINENVPFVHAAGACAMIHSDDQNNIQRLNQEVAKTWADGNRAGLDISKAEAWKWLSTNPAKALGILEETGTLEAGKRADLIIWDGDPFSTYSRPATVMVDGAVLFDKSTGLKPKSDFRLGYADLTEEAK